MAVGETGKVDSTDLSIPARAVEQAQDSLDGQAAFWQESCAETDRGSVILSGV